MTKVLLLMWGALCAFLFPGVNTTSFPARVFPSGGLTPDNSAMFGVLGALANASVQAGDDVVAIAYGAATALTMTGAQFINAVWDLSGSGVLALTTPTYAQILAALPPTIPKDGFGYIIYVLNDSTGQTTTVTAGSGVTIVGTATVATATTRLFMFNVNVNNAAVTLVNLGGISL